MVSQNSINNTVYDNDFTVTRRDAGPSDVTCNVTHVGVPNLNSNAQYLVSTPAGGGDPSLRMAISGVQEYPFGIQHATNDLVIGVSPGTPSATTPAWRMTPNGERTMPLQPAFFAALSSATGGVTGAGGVYVLGNNGGGTTAIITDQGSNLSFVAGDLTFTAPVTGFYMLGWQITVTGVTALMTAAGSSILSTAPLGAINGMVINPGTSATLATNLSGNQQAAFFITAGNTFTFNYQITGGVADTVSAVPGNTVTNAWGYLVC